MAVHRYKYAIGNAPIRFPAADNKDKAEEGKMTDKAETNKKDTLKVGKSSSRRSSKSSSTGKNRWTMFAGDAQDVHTGASVASGSSAASIESVVSTGQLSTDLKMSASTSNLRKPSPQRAGQNSQSNHVGGDVPARTTSPFSLAPSWTRSRKGSTSSERSDPGALASPDISERTRALLTTTPVPSASSTPMRSQTGSPGLAATSNMRASSPRFPSPFRAWRSTTTPQPLTAADAQGSPAGADARTPLLRPHSHFWTDMNASPRSPTMQGGAASTGSKTPRASSVIDHRDRTLSNASRTKIRQYGAVEDKKSTKRQAPGNTRHSQLLLQSSSASPAYDADDPYGYRALAGPTLLPAFHEQRQQQQLRLQQDRSCWRTCLSTRYVTLLLLFMFSAFALTALVTL